MLQFLNYFFFVFHTLLTFFNLFGWISRRTRKWNLITLSLTALSWFGMGIWFGWGYCLCTDWHWDVREQMGYYDQSRSYIHFLILKIMGLNLNERMVETLTVILFFASLVVSVVLNLTDFKRSKIKPV